jgi:RNase adaptor protein for sRNA GlmZ degradation
MGKGKQPAVVEKYPFQEDRLTFEEIAEHVRLRGANKTEWETNKGIEQAWRERGSIARVYSFGMDTSGAPRDSERSFDCRRLNLRGHGLDLRFGRGCDPEFQAEAESDPEFLKFITLVAKCVMDNNYQVISFYCSKGHHRSVAAATLFARKFAPQVEVIHLCLKK